MKRILTLLLALIVFASFALCSCGGNKTTTTTTSGEQNPPAPGPTLDVEELIQNILSGNFEAIELSLPDCEITTEGLDALFFPQAGAATPFDKILIKDNTIYLPCDGVEGFDQNDELSGMYVVVDAGKIHLVNYMNGEQKSVQSISIEEMIAEFTDRYLPSEGEGEIIPGVGDLNDLQDMLEPIIEKIEAAIEGMPELKEEHKLYLQSDEGTKYRIEKDYFKEVIEYIYGVVIDVIEDTTGEPVVAEIPEEVWAVIDMMTIEVDVTEKDGAVVAVDALVALEIPDNGGFSMELSANENGAEMDFTFAMEEMTMSYHVAAGLDNMEMNCEIKSPNMNMDMDMSMTMGETVMEYSVDMNMEMVSTYGYGDGENTYTNTSASSVDMSLDMKMDASKIFTKGATWLEYNMDMNQVAEYTEKKNGVIVGTDSYETSMGMDMTGATSNDGAYSLGISMENDGVKMIDASVTLKFTEVTIPDISGVIKSAE